MAAYSSQLVTFGSPWLDVVLAAFKTANTAALINNAKCRLSTAPGFTPSPVQTIAGFTPNEANFSGYTSGGDAVVLSTPVNLSPTCEGVFVAVNFICTASTTPNVVWGYWLDDGTNVILAEKFPAPGFSFANSGDFLALLIQIPQQNFQATQ